MNQNSFLYELFRSKFRDKQKNHLQLKLTEKKLKNILFSAFKIFLFKFVFLFIDVLNECNKQKMRKIVNFFETLNIKFNVYRWLTTFVAIAKRNFLILWRSRNEMTKIHFERAWINSRKITDVMCVMKTSDQFNSC